VHLNNALQVKTSESRSFNVIRKDKISLVNKDGSKLTANQAKWINDASATNIGTAIGLNNFEVTGIVIRQDYNSFGWKCGGDVTFVTSE
tara:strand:+ start:1596 stop:1862 length:267 start_codon:yes stop_codon:yes gene_type:complete